MVICGFVLPWLLHLLLLFLLIADLLPLETADASRTGDTFGPCAQNRSTSVGLSHKVAAATGKFILNAT